MSPIPPTVTLPIGYEPVKKTDSKGKNGEWQCPVIGCGKVYTRKRPLMEHLANGGPSGHLHHKLVDTSLGTFTIKPATAEDGEKEEGDDVPSPALGPSLAAGLGVSVDALSSPSPSAPSLAASQLQTDAAEVAEELTGLDELGQHWDPVMGLSDAAEGDATLDAQLDATQAALELQELQVAMAGHMVPGYEGDYLDLSDVVPPPPKKKRKTSKKKVEKEHRYASLKELEDEDLRRQLERRRQGFVSDREVARDSGGFEQDPGTAELMGEKEQREVFLKQVREKNVAKAVHAVGGTEDKSAKGIGKKQFTIKESLTKGSKNEKETGKAKEWTGQPEDASEEEQAAVLTQMEVDEEKEDVTISDGAVQRPKEKESNERSAAEEDERDSLSVGSLRAKRCAWLPVL